MPQTYAFFFTAKRSALFFFNLSIFIYRKTVSFGKITFIKGNYLFNRRFIFINERTVYSSGLPNWYYFSLNKISFTIQSNFKNRSNTA